MRNDEPMERDDLDAILDDALSSYSTVAPRPGLEERVKSAVRSSANQPTFAGWRWALAAAGGVVVVVCAIGWLRPGSVPAPEDPPATVAREARAVKQPPAGDPTPVVSPEPAREPERAVPTPRQTRPVVAAASSRKPLPKEPVFPTASPLTDEERALLAWVRRDPEQAREVLTVARNEALAPIQIDEIRIEPLAIDR